MKDFQARRRAKKIIFSWLTITILLVANLLLLKSNIQLYAKERYTAHNQQMAQKEYDDVVARQQSLAADVARLGTAEGVDLELRRKYQVVMPGEETVIIVNAATSTSEPKLEENAGIWENLMDWLGW